MIQFMKIILLIVAGICLITSIYAYKHFRKRTDDAGFAVIELFTSEGCSSCPPADQLLSRINKTYNGKPVYVLSFHVDYWDNLGWKDRFSKQQFTTRQKMYDQSLHTDTYTPQAVINGKKEALGSDEKSITQFIRNMLLADTKNKSLQCTLSIEKGKLHVAYQADQAQSGNIINIALVQDNVSDRVTAGENKGKDMEHVNVVREFKSETVKKAIGNLTLSIPDDLKTDSLHIIAYTQNRADLQMVSAFSSAIKYQ